MNILSRVNRQVILSVFALVYVGALPARGQSPEEYTQRRQKIIEKMAPNSILVLRSRGPAGNFQPFRQDSDMYYASGVNEPGAFLVLSVPPEGTGGAGDSGEAVLFITPKNPETADWDPPTLGIEGARNMPGFTDVKPSNDFQGVFELLLMENPSVVYMNYKRSQGVLSPLTTDEELFKRARDKGAGFTVKTPDSLIHPLRRIKSPAEIANLTRAIDITAGAQREAMRSVTEGMTENQLKAISEMVFGINGAPTVGFMSNFSSGANTVILHWRGSDKVIRNGELLLADIGAEYNRYTADITRTFPVSGTFTDRQRRVYNAVLKAQQTAMDMLKPGAVWREISERVNNVIAGELEEMGLIQDSSELRRYYFHGLGHNIGLDVHDVGGIGVLEPGMVLTVEPGIYIREEGLGVRIEDDFLITETGYVHLSKRAPRTVEEIEAVMQEEGTDFFRYVIK